MTNQTVTTALSKAAGSGVVGDARAIVLAFLKQLDNTYHADRELAYGIGRLRQMVEETRPGMGEPIRCATRCDQWPNCRHDWRGWEAR